FMPHRDVQKTEAFATLSSKEIVNEYLKDNAAANNKYLEKDGNSKVLIIKGTIFSVSKDQNNQTVILLKDAGESAGVSCTFLPEAGERIKNLKIGDKIKVKGFITLGASYDEDLEMYEDVIMQDCDIVK
ncbi:MAG: OB-fold putative lipoprotein, partial [Bacteroidales bacterium]|nr:OB-fold putative lipoprotein [Bacteroidales bacterium]